MARILVHRSSESGSQINFSASDTTNGDTFNNANGRTLVLLKNTHATEAASFTVQANGDTSEFVPGYGIMTKSSQTISVPAGETIVAGPFPVTSYNDENGLSVVAAAATGTPEIAGLNV